MGISYAHALGRNRKFLCAAESSAGTAATLAGTDAAKVLKSTMTLEQARDVRMDSRQTRSALERITGKGKVSWTVDAEIIPSGTAGTPPDLHPLLYAAFGAYTNIPATSDSYTLSDSQTIRTCTLYHEFSGVMSEMATGAWVEECKVSGSGGDRPKLTMTGGAMGYVATGTSTLNGAMVGSTTMIVQTADAYSFGVGSLITIGTTDAKVTVATAAPSFTVTPSTSESNGATVVPWSPTETTTGTPLSQIAGTITINSVAFNLTAFEVTLKQNLKPNDDEALLQFASDVVPGWRDVTGSFTFRARKDRIATALKRQAHGQIAATIVIGSVAGKRCTLSLPTLELDYGVFDFPEADEAVFAVPFRAMGTSAGANEYSLTFT